MVVVESERVDADVEVRPWVRWSRVVGNTRLEFLLLVAGQQINQIHAVDLTDGATRTPA